MQSLTTKALGELGNAGGHSGRTGLLMKKRCAKPAVACNHEDAPCRDDPKIELYDPDLWTDEYAFLNGRGQAQIQSDLFYDYRTNVDAYPKCRRGYRRRSQSFWSYGASTISRSIPASRTLPQGRTEC